MLEVGYPKYERIETDYIIAMIAANLAKGQSVPEAVFAAFKFMEEMLKGGRYFN